MLAKMISNKPVLFSLFLLPLLLAACAPAEAEPTPTALPTPIPTPTGPQTLAALGTVCGLGRQPHGLQSCLLLDEERAIIIDGLRLLSPRQRDCLVLRFYLDLKEREIAETLGISPNSVKTHCRRGMAALKSILEVPA